MLPIKNQTGAETMHAWMSIKTPPFMVTAMPLFTVYFGMTGIRLVKLVSKGNRNGQLNQMSLEVLVECFTCFTFLQYHLLYLTVSERGKTIGNCCGTVNGSFEIGDVLR